MNTQDTGIRQTCRRRGFTLIELLVVVAIIAVLLAILTPTLMKSRILTKQTICAAHCGQMAKAANQWALDHKMILPQPNRPGEGVYAVFARYFKAIQPGGRYRSHGLMARFDYMPAKIMYCPLWTFEDCIYGKANPPGTYIGGPYWPLDELPSHQQWMQTSYHYRCTFDINNGKPPRQANMSMDSPNDAFLADAFTCPWRGVDQCHETGYNVAYLGGHVAFVEDKDFLIRDFGGSVGYHDSLTDFKKQETVWKKLLVDN